MKQHTEKCLLKRAHDLNLSYFITKVYSLTKQYSYSGRLLTGKTLYWPGQNKHFAMNIFSDSCEFLSHVFDSDGLCPDMDTGSHAASEATECVFFCLYF